jgi:hypothetical protein
MSDSEHKKEIIYVEYEGYIDDVAAYEMMNKLNLDPYTRIIHTTFIQSQNKRIFMLMKTKIPWIKVVGRYDVLRLAADHGCVFKVDPFWLIGNIKTTHTFDTVDNKELKKLIGKNSELMHVLNLSYIYAKRKVENDQTIVELLYTNRKDLFWEELDN